MIAASLQAWPIGVWQATWQSERCVKHLAANEREAKTWFFIAIRAARIHQKHSQISVRRRNWRKAWARLDARMITPPWSAILTRWRMKKFIFTSITMRNLSIAPLSILPIPRTTMYVRILITVTVRHSKRGIRHKFIGHLCYKNAWPQQPPVWRVVMICINSSNSIRQTSHLPAFMWDWLKGCYLKFQP